MGAERRIHARYDVVAQVELGASGDETVMLPLRNVSQGGALLGVSDDQAPSLRLGDEVSAFFDFGSDEAGLDLAVSLDAEIVRIVKDAGRSVAVAIRWVGESEAERYKLGVMIRQLAGDA